jgi:predicted ester cyclase
MSTAEEATNKATTERFDDVLNSGDAELIFTTIDEVVAPDALISTPLAIDATGAELAKELFALLLRAYPDLHITIEDLIAEGDKVVSRNTVSGTHQGEYMGIPPTGNSVTYNEVIITRFADGRIVETWAVVDVLAQMRQLGVIPAPPSNQPPRRPVRRPEPAQGLRKDHER